MPEIVSTEPAAHDVVHATLARLHTWIDEVPRPQRRLGKFLVGAALIHVAVFFFILIDNPRPEIRHDIHPEVTLDTTAAGEPASPDNAFWDEMTDPRLYILPQSSESTRILWVDPLSAIHVHAQPVAMPSPAEIASFPFLNQPLPSLNERVTDALQPARQPFTYLENPPPIARATTWQWGDILAARSPAGVPQLPSPVSDMEINPTRLRVAVTPEGTVSDVVLDQSSQKPELDQQAIYAVQKTRFQPVNQPGIAWGMVTIAWYYTPKPQEVVPPPAPLAP
jgi:TonB family protein